MDVNRLCPGCMREVDAGIQKMKIQREVPQNRGSGEAQNQRKCPHCGFCADTYKQNARCLPINTILAGKYLVGAVLGEGGFGITYIGYDLNMQTRIAIKEYFPVELVSRDTTSMTGDRVISLSGDKSATYKQGLKKYVTEAQNVSQFSEIPGVVSVKDFFYENETAYIVMEYIDGISLKDYLKERGGRLSEEESLAIMEPVLEALVKVHEAGIIHRDISPDNIMLTFWSGSDSGNIRGYGAVTGYDTAGQRGVSVGDTDVDKPASSGSIAAEKESADVRTAHRESGTSDMTAKGDGAISDIASVKLIDFGAARMTAKNDQKSLTIILKHGYAPEEQYRTHSEQGPWTDVYAVCAVLYRMLTGQTPVPAMDRMFQDELKSFQDLNTKVSRNTQTAILKGLAVKKEDRIQTVDELMQVLADGRARKRDAYVWYRYRKNLRLAAVMAAGILLLSAAILVPMIRRKAPSASALPEGQENPESQQSADMAEGMQEDIGAGTAGVEKEAEKTGESEGVDSPDREAVVTWQEDEKLGTQIVWPKPETIIAAGGSHILSLREDGTVLAAGSNTSGQCDIGDWEHIAAVYAFGNTSAGLSTDGRVFIAGNPFLEEGVEAWRGVVSLALGYYHIVGLLEDGTVVSAGNNDNGRCDTGDWKEIAYISAGYDLTMGVTRDGSVRIAGSRSGEEDVLDSVRQWTDMAKVFVQNNAELTFYGIKKDGTVLCRGQLEEDNLFGGRTDVIDIAVSDYGWSAGLLKDGRVLSDGWMVRELETWTDMAALAATRDDIIGLGQDGCIRITESDMRESTAGALEEIKALEHVAQTEWGDGLLVVLRDDGTVRTIGYDGHSSGLDNSDMDRWTGVAQIGLTYGEGIAGLTSDKRVVIADPGVTSFGDDLPEGLSWEERKEEVERRKKQTPNLTKEWDDIIEISCSKSHIAALTEDGTVRAAGYAFNQWMTDYRTGLTKDGACETGDFAGIRQVAAIYGMTVGLKEDGTLIATGDMPEEWKACARLTSIWRGGDTVLAAIKEDGTVQHLSGSNQYGQQNTMGWDNLIQLALSDGHTVGLKGDGTVVAAGANYCGQCDVEGWTDIVSISAGPSSTIGITSAGKVLIAGTVPNDYYGAEMWRPVSIGDLMSENPDWTGQ